MTRSHQILMHWNIHPITKTDEYECYSKHYSDEIVENDFAYFIVENYEQSCKKVESS